MNTITKKMYGMMLIYSLLVWLTSFVMFKDSLPALNFCLLAYTLGLRHALDADHISAIDNLIRKMIGEEKDPTQVGLFFSLGHSTVVVLLCVLVAIAAPTIFPQFSSYKEYGSVIGSAVSITFLVGLSLFNIFTLFQVAKKFKNVKNNIEDQERARTSIMPLNFILKSFLKLKTKNWHVYFIGFLFGLSFDTSTEIALLGITATQAVNGVIWQSILILPCLFLAGMCLLDMTIGVMVTSVCRQSLKNNHYFDNFITLLISGFALLVASLQLLHIISGYIKPWHVIEVLNDNITTIGMITVAILLLSGLWIRYRKNHPLTQTSGTR